MISFKQFRRFLINTSLVVMLASIITFGLGATDSWATNSLTQISPQPLAEISMNGAEKMVKNLEEKAQEAMGKFKGSPKAEAEENAKEFKAKTLEGIDKSIENPDYQPGGKTKQTEKEDSKITSDIKDEARKAMD
jgi:hypothetical protein